MCKRRAFARACKQICVFVDACLCMCANRCDTKRHSDTPDGEIPLIRGVGKKECGGGVTVQ